MNKQDFNNPYYKSSGYADEDAGLLGQVAAGAASSLSPVALGANLAGTALQAYGTYQQGDQAQKQYALQVQAWKEEQERQRREEDGRRQQQLLDNVMGGGNYAQGLVKNAQSAYGSYARQAGL